MLVNVYNREDNTEIPEIGGRSLEGSQVITDVRTPVGVE